MDEAIAATNWRGRVERRVKKKTEGERKKGRGRRGRVAVRRTWWTVHGCQKRPMASHMHLTSPSGREQAAL